MSPHPNGWSLDLAWNRNKTIDPVWKHWFSLIASMGDRFIQGSIKELR